MGLNIVTKIPTYLCVFLINTSIGHVHFSASYPYDQHKHDLVSAKICFVLVVCHYDFASTRICTLHIHAVSTLF